MALQGLTKASTRLFESAKDPDKGNPNATRFKLAFIDSFVTAYLKDKLTSFEADPNDATKVVSVYSPNEIHIETVRFGLKGWENFKDEEGNDIEFKTVKRRMGGRSYDVVSDELLGNLPMSLIEELAVEIRRLNIVTVAEAKNSVSAS